MNHPELDDSRENVGERYKHKVVQGCWIRYLNKTKTRIIMFKSSTTQTSL